MRSVEVFLIAMMMLLGAKSAHAQAGSFPDMGQADEPAVQSDESVAEFVKGLGGNPKNGKSFFHKGIKLKTPVTGGSGCESGTVGAALTEDKKTLSIVFDNYVAEAGVSSGVKRDVKTCSVSVPVEVPAGMQFMVVKLDYRGFNSIPKNARTRYVTMYSLINENGKQMGKRIRRRFDFFGPLESDYVLSSDISNQMVWSKCGKTVNFRIDTRAVAATNKKGEDTMATIDSIDAATTSPSSNVAYHLLWQECKG